MQVQGNGKFSISCIDALVFAFAIAFAFAFALRLFKHAFTCTFACVCVCVARVNHPYELFYSAGFTNFIYYFAVEVSLITMSAKRTIESFFTASLKRSCQHIENQNCSG